MEQKLKNLDFIQNTISRLSSNSFSIKGWTVTIMSALFVFLDRQSGYDQTLILILPIISFWILDGYFLSQERRFVTLFEKVKFLSEENISFEMKPIKTSKRESWINSIFSTTLTIFYGTILTITVVIVIIQYNI